MFHVEFLIDDKHLAKMHHALHGLRLFNLDVRPVVNAKVSGGKVREANTAPPCEQLVAALRTAFTGQTFGLDDIKSIAEKLGVNVHATMMKRLVGSKQLRRISRGKYTLTARK